MEKDKEIKKNVTTAKNKKVVTKKSNNKKVNNNNKNSTQNNKYNKKSNIKYSSNKNNSKKNNDSRTNTNYKKNNVHQNKKKKTTVSKKREVERIRKEEVVTKVKSNQTKNNQKGILKSEVFVNLEEIERVKEEYRKNLLLKKKKAQKIKRLLWMILILLIICFIVTSILLFREYSDQKQEKELKQSQDNLIETIKLHYGDVAVVNKDTVLYRLNDDNSYYEYGMIYKDTEVYLEPLEITHLTEYFYSTDLDSYIKYSDLTPIDSTSAYDDRYKNYIVFDKNVVTNNQFSLYDNNKKIYTINESMSFPIIINNYDNKYFVEFNDRLLYILKEDVKEVVKKENSNARIASKITTLCYHRIYDTNEKCNDLYICKSKKNFDKEMKYLNDNNYFTLTMQEVYWYLNRHIQIPRNSVVITMDDGYLWENAIEVLEKYDLNGTGFVKTKAIEDLSIYESFNFELHSHTHNMHNAGVCKKEASYQQGGGILCLPEDKILSDLKASRDRLNGSIALAYPFYDYNNRAINLVKKAGFKLAFVGTSGTAGRSSPGVNLYKIPRVTIWDTTNLNTFKNYVNN